MAIDPLAEDLVPDVAGRGATRAGPKRADAPTSYAGALNQTSPTGCSPGHLPDTVAEVFRHGADAWSPFIEEFSPFLFACIRRLTRQYDERMEIYAYTCGRLRAEDCRRVKQFRGTGPSGACKFTTWLAAVTFNLGREWIRTSRGRRRMYLGVQALSPIHQMVFRYYYWEGYSAHEVGQMLRTNHAIDCTDADIEDCLTLIRETLSRDHHWRLTLAGPGRGALVSLDVEPSDGQPRRVRELECPGVPAEQAVTQERAVIALREAVRRLTNAERTAVALRFRHGMSARKIAEILGLANYKQVYELQARGLAALRNDMLDAGLRISDFGTPPALMEALR